ncbi:MAG TPA: hypothetical protein VGF46_08750 [Gaiellales bacterium]
MSATSRQPGRPLLLWFGLLGAPAAWAIQFWTGLALALAGCDAAGRGASSLPLNGLAAATAAVAVVIAGSALAASIAMYRATRDPSEQPPASRVHFLATIGMAVSSLLLCIIVLDGVGATLIDRCHQG